MKDDNDNFEMFTPEDVSLHEDDVYDGETEDEDEFDGDKFEEEYRRRQEEEKQERRKEKFRAVMIAAAVLAVIVIVLLVAFTSVGDTYRKNFKNNFDKLFYTEPAIDIGATEKSSNVQEYVDEERALKVKSIGNTSKNVKVVPFEGAASGSFEPYQGGLICAKSNYLSFIDSAGNVKWEKDTSVADPILSVDGQYAALAAQGGTKLCMYSGEDLVFECSTSDKIKNMRVSANGDVVLVCDRENYKGAIVVYNRDGKEVFSWSSGKNDVISADISSASRRVAAALLNTDKKVYSVIKVFDITSKVNSEEAVFDDTIIFNIDYAGDTVTGFGDNSLVSVTSMGKVLTDKRFDRVDISRYAFDSEGNRLVHFDSAGIPVFHLYGKKGVLKSEMLADNFADCTAVKGDLILYNDSRDVILRRMGSDRINEYTATMDILDLVLINTRVYGIVHSNSIEIVGV